MDCYKLLHVKSFGIVWCLRQSVVYWSFSDYSEEYRHGEFYLTSISDFLEEVYTFIATFEKEHSHRLYLIDCIHTKLNSFECCVISNIQQALQTNINQLDLEEKISLMIFCNAIVAELINKSFDRCSTRC